MRLTLTLTSIDMMLEIKSRQRDRRCAVLFFLFSHTAETPSSYLTRVLGFSTTPVFFLIPSPFFFSFFFFLPFLCKWAPAIFHFGNRRSPPIDPAQKPQDPACVCKWNGVPAIFHFGNQGSSPNKTPPKSPRTPRCVFPLEWAPAIFHFGNQESPPI